MKHAAKLLIAVFVVFGVLTTSGCDENRKVQFEEQTAPLSIDTLDEQRTWIGEQFDAIIAASGSSEGWFDTFSDEVLWAEDREIDRYKVLGSLFPRACGTGGRLSEGLLNNSLEQPMAAARQVRATWESEGWIISDIRPYDEDSSVYFRADREDGAVLAFGATTERVWLEAATRCSAHATVRFPFSYSNKDSIHVKKLRELQDAAGIPWGNELEEWQEKQRADSAGVDADAAEGRNNEASTDAPGP